MLGGTHVRAAVEHIGGKTRADVGHGGRDAAAGDGEIGGAQAAKHGQRVFRSTALALDQCKVVVGELKFGAGLAGGETVGEPGIGFALQQVECFLAAFDRVMDHRLLRIKPANQEILACGFGGDAQALRVEQSLGGGGLGDAGF